MKTVQELENLCNTTVARLTASTVSHDCWGAREKTPPDAEAQETATLITDLLDRVKFHQSLADLLLLQTDKVSVDPQQVYEHCQALLG